MDFYGKTALITGASRGIGRATAIAMAKNGANIVVNYLNAADAAAEVVALVEACGRRAIAMKADVRNLDEVKAMVAQAKNEFGSIDILVNNAGVICDKPVTFMNDEAWNEVLDTSLKGSFHCIKVVAKEMARKKYGKIVNISSDAGLLGDLMRANYSSAKAGLIGLTKAVARELSPSGINVNAVAPGIVETDLIAGMSEQRREELLRHIPQKRFGKAEEIAEVVLFLVSDAAAYITGQVLCVDGGLRM